VAWRADWFADALSWRCAWLEDVVVEAVDWRACWLADADDWALEAAPWRDCWLAEAAAPPWPDCAALADLPECEVPPLRCEKLPLPAVPWRE
jgi:hypothetical protein